MNLATKKEKSTFLTWKSTLPPSYLGFSKLSTKFHFVLL